MHQRPNPSLTGWIGGGRHFHPQVPTPKCDIVQWYWSVLLRSDLIPTLPLCYAKPEPTCCAHVCGCSVYWQEVGQLHCQPLVKHCSWWEKARHIAAEITNGFDSIHAYAGETVITIWNLFAATSFQTDATGTKIMKFQVETIELTLQWISCFPREVHNQICGSRTEWQWQKEFQSTQGFLSFLLSFQCLLFTRAMFSIHREMPSLSSTRWLYYSKDQA